MEVLNNLRLIPFIVCVALGVSCSRFEKEAYIKEEDNVLRDMVPSMVDADYMLANNDFGSSRPILYVIEDLSNELELRQFDSIGALDQRGLAPLLNSKMAERKISSDLLTEYKDFDVKLLTVGEFERDHQDRMVEIIDRGGVFGYLGISRVVLDSEFKKGYVSFGFFCGSGCGWDSTIEIINENGRWRKGRFLFGGIA